MTFTVNSEEKTQGVFIIYPDGKLDSNTSQALEKELKSVLANSPELIVMDLKTLEYMSSAGVRVFVKAQKEMKKQNGAIRFINIQPQIQKVFDIIKALPSEKVFENYAEMDRYLHEMQRKVIEENI